MDQQFLAELRTQIAEEAPDNLELAQNEWGCSGGGCSGGGCSGGGCSGNGGFSDFGNGGFSDFNWSDYVDGGDDWWKD